MLAFVATILDEPSSGRGASYSSSPSRGAEPGCLRFNKGAASGKSPYRCVLRDHVGIAKLQAVGLNRDSEALQSIVDRHVQLLMRDLRSTNGRFGKRADAVDVSKVR